MHIIFIGQIGQDVTSRFAEQGVSIINTFPHLTVFSMFANTPGNKVPVDAVVVIPSAFDKKSNIVEQIDTLQRGIAILGYKPLLLIFFSKSSNNLYQEVYQSGILSYSPSKVELLFDLQIKDMIEVITGRPVAAPARILTRMDFSDLQSTKMETSVKKSEDVSRHNQSSVRQSNLFDISPTGTAVTDQQMSEEEIRKQKEWLLRDTSDRFSPPIGAYHGPDGKLIVVASLLPGCGSTFISTNISWQLSLANYTSSLIEHPETEPALLSLLGEKRNAPSNWSSVVKRIKSGEEITKRDYWKEGNIVWFPLERSDYGITLTHDELIGLFVATKVSKFTFVDISTNWDSTRLSQILEVADEIWCVVTPSKKMEMRIEEFRVAMANFANKVVFVGNRFSGYSSGKGVAGDINSLIQRGKSKSIYGKVWEESYIQYQIPEFDASKVQKAEWGDTSISKLVESQAEARNGFFDLLKRLVPNVVNRKVGAR